MVAGFLLLLGLTPLLVNEQRKRLGVSLSTPALAIEDVRAGRLSGTLFGDLGVLRAILPDSAPVRHLMADVHVRLGQWPLGRDLYIQVLDEEPGNSAAALGAGVCAFHLGDFDRAIELFRQAVVADPGNATAHFNLSQTYSELLRFDESARALRDAQRLAPQQVGRWIREAAESRVIAAGGGLERTAADPAPDRRRLAVRRGQGILVPVAAAGSPLCRHRHGPATADPGRRPLGPAGERRRGVQPLAAHLPAGPCREHGPEAASGVDRPARAVGAAGPAAGGALGLSPAVALRAGQRARLVGDASGAHGLGADSFPAAEAQADADVDHRDELMEGVEGRIEERHLAEVLLLLARRRGRGILTVQGEQEIIGLSIFEGQLVSADALNQSLEEGLGRILTASGLVSNDVLASLGAEHHAGGGRVVDLLLERNYIGRDTLTAALREHAYGLCVQVLAWKAGEYKFYRGDEVAFEEGVEAIPVEEVLVRAADELDSAELLGARPPSAEAVFERVDRLDTGMAAETLGELLSPGLASAEPGEEILALLDRADGSRTAGLLAHDAGMSEHRARLTLLRMEQADLLRRREGAATAPARQAFSAANRPAPPPALDMVRLDPMAPPAPATVQLPVMEPRIEEPAAPEPVPVPAPPPEPRPARTARPRRAEAPPPWLARLLAAGLLLAVAISCLAAPWKLFLPFPWEADLRQAFDTERQTGIFLQVDRAARTFFLLEGRFPETLAELEQAGLLARGEVVDAQGRALDYSATSTSFSLQAPAGASRTEGIGGNFLLDPEFQARAGRDEAPLVLLD